MRRTTRAGMTLVELLVVVAILGLLAIAVLPSIGNTIEGRRTREATRTVTGFIAKAQARALGRREWSGFMLVATNTVSSYAAVDLTLADVPPVYRGDTVPATLTITGSSATRRLATNPSSVLTSATASVQANDLIRFTGGGPAYEITAVTGTSVEFRPRGNDAFANEDAGFQLHNTPWPPLSAPLATGSTPLTFEILRQPVPSGAPLTLGDGRAIDLYWSGCGPASLTVGSNAFGTFAYRPFVTVSTNTAATAGASASILFDGTGRLRQVICRSGSTVYRQAVTGAVFLLVGRADRCGTTATATLDPGNDTLGTNWQYPDSQWIGIDPLTGAVRAAECTGTATDVVGSQAAIRQALLATGR